MNRKDVIDALALKMDTTKKAAGEFIDAFVEVVSESLKDGDSVRLVGFGTFDVTERPEREGRNPSTGETIKIASSRSPKFKPSKVLKDFVNE